ncbi:hypothetical protein WP8S17C03_12160 [Metapseudomonas otitidis]|uniref:Uncharacterized protein n=1 Tax=Metapseudomonas otitidis TaxID=319939 RepID=A0A6S5RL80_9GAMM|nr:hypothetical protein WP8S17C03_12160 [Pseudomonas otitidis]
MPEPIRKPGRLWQPITSAATQDQLQRAAHRHPVPGRHHQRRHAVPTAQHPADLFALVLQRHMLATGKAWLSVMPHQHLLRHADGRQPGHHAKVRRNTEPARMGDPLPVAEHQVRPLRQSSERLQQRRQFTEGQQPRHVGHGRRHPRHHLAQQAVVIGIQQHRGSPGDLSALLEADVDTCHHLQRREIIHQHHPRSQFALQALGMAGAAVPVIEGGSTHERAPENRHRVDTEPAGRVRRTARRRTRCLTANGQ